MKRMTRVQSIPILFIYLVKVGLIKFSSSFNFAERTNLCFSRYDLWMIITCSKADIALCEGIRISESAKFLLVESWIQQMFAEESGIPLEESGIPLMIGHWNPTDDWNPESKFHWQGLQNPSPGIRNPESLAWTDPKCQFWAQVAQARNMSIGDHRHCCVTFKI